MAPEIFEECGIEWPEAECWGLKSVCVVGGGLLLAGYFRGGKGKGRGRERVCVL